MDRLNIILLISFILLGYLALDVLSDGELTLTRSQNDKFDKFKDRVLKKLTQDYQKQDIYLIKWLRAKNFNVNAAEAMLTASLRWRKEKSIDRIDDEDWSDCERDFPLTFDGHDKSGSPIMTFNFGEWDIRKATLSGKFPKLQRWVDKIFEDGARKIRTLQAQNKNVTQWYLLANIGEFSLPIQACIQCLPLYTINWVGTLQNHYPGDLKKIMLINTPQAFDVVLNLARPVMTQATSDALKVYTNNKAEWGAVIANDIDESEIRKEFGGTKSSELH